MWQVFGSAAAALGSAALNAGGQYLSAQSSNDTSAANAALQYQYQKEFAQNGIRWRVADAKAAGIHPLAALGAQTFSYNPVAVQAGDNGVGRALASMGQGIDRAVNAKALAEERALDMQLKNAQIANVNAQTDAVRAQAAASRAATARSALPPPMPRANEHNQSPYWEKPIVSDSFRLDHRGRPVDIIPSQALKDRVEDIFGVEWMPFITAWIDNFKAKQLGWKVKDHWWDDEKGHYTKKKPSSRSSGFGRNIKNSYSFY